MAELVPIWPEGPDAEERLTKLVLNSVTSHHTRRAYETGLDQFFAWLRSRRPPQPLSKSLLQEYRA